MALYAIMAVQLFRDVQEEAFGDFGKAMYTMFSITTMDGWQVLARPIASVCAQDCMRACMCIVSVSVSVSALVSVRLSVRLTIYFVHACFACIFACLFAHVCPSLCLLCIQGSCSELLPLTPQPFPCPPMNVRRSQ